MTAKRQPKPSSKTARPAPKLGAILVQRFGALVRERRRELKLTQDDLALASGVGRRFIIDLEDGKASVQLGKALLVAEALGLRIFDLMTHAETGGPLLPDLPDETDLPP